MKNLFISNLNEKDINHFTTDTGLKLRRDLDKPFKKLCNIFTGAKIKKIKSDENLSDEEYFNNLSTEYIPISEYNLKKGNNIIIERYPKLNKDEPYIFVCNHTCPEDIETVLNIIDRNAYLILGSIESLKYNKEMYLSWLNGMIPFEILDKKERKELIPKMERVLKTNSILIFPEGSHNYSPNNLINKLFDGPVNLSLKTNRKIVIVTLLKDQENNISYIDVSNPVDLIELDVKYDDTLTGQEKEKKYVNKLTNIIRDKMATSVYYMIERHFKEINHKENIEEELRLEKVEDAFKKLKWKKDVFEAEYLVKKDEKDRTHEEVINTISNLRFNIETLRNTNLGNREYIILNEDLDRKNVEKAMRRNLIKEQEKKLIKKK